MQIMNYRSRISGPLLDRIDIHCTVPAVRFKELSGETITETSSEVKKRVDAARLVQAKRFEDKKVSSNSRIPARLIKKYCPIGKDSARLLETAVDRLGLSARAYTRILKVSRTVADLDGAEDILPRHVSEAIQYRTLDRDIV